jgi:hypothetical protein
MAVWLHAFIFSAVVASLSGGKLQDVLGKGLMGPVTNLDDVETRAVCALAGSRTKIFQSREKIAPPSGVHPGLPALILVTVSTELPRL